MLSVAQVLHPLVGTSAIATSFDTHQTDAIRTPGRLVALEVCRRVDTAVMRDPSCIKQCELHGPCRCSTAPMMVATLMNSPSGARYTHCSPSFYITAFLAGDSHSRAPSAIIRDSSLYDLALFVVISFYAFCARRC